jgi:hypothetical protein
MRACSLWLAILAALLVAAVVMAGEPVVPEIKVPDKAVEHSLVVVSTTAEGTGYAWFVFGPRQMEEWKPILGNKSSVVFTGPPGRYTIMLVVALPDGKLNQGYAVVTIVPDDDPEPPDPPDPPPPDQKWQVAFFFDTDKLDDYTDDQLVLLSGLRFRQALVDAGNIFVGSFNVDSLDKGKKPAANLEPWFASVRGKSMPRVALAPHDGGTIRHFPLPENEAALKKLLADTPQGRAAR